MARSLADPLYERLLDAFPPTRAYTRADWNADTMPEPVAHFLGQLLKHYSRREARHLRRARSEWVDYDHPEMEKAVRTFFEAVEAHTRVPADEWEDTLRQATHHTTAHLVRPVHVLTDFVYAERRKPLRLPEVLWRMNFFGPYGYLREAIHAFAKKQNLDALGPDRFESFLHRVDRRITSDYDADRWLRVLDPLFSVARRALGREQIPVALVQAFFSEKARPDVERRLRAYAREGRDVVAPRALHRLIEEAEAAPSSGAPAPSDEQRRTPPVSGEDAPKEPPSSEPSSPSSDDEIWGVAGAARPAGAEEPQPSEDDAGDVPLWKRFQQGRARSSGTPNASEPDDGGDETGQGGEPLWARFRQQRDERLSEVVSESSSPTDGSGSDARTRGRSSSNSASTGSGDLEALERRALGVSNPPHRSVYVRQLFGGDRANYRKVLQRLAGAESWGEASQIIASDIFRAHKVNIYSDAAVHFTNAVESRFRE